MTLSPTTEAISVLSVQASFGYSTLASEEKARVRSDNDSIRKL